MEIGQLQKHIAKEIGMGHKYNRVVIRTWGADGCDSIDIKAIVSCSDAIVIIPDEKLTPMKEYIARVKRSFREYYDGLVKWLEH